MYCNDDAINIDKDNIKFEKDQIFEKNLNQGNTSQIEISIVINR